MFDLSKANDALARSALQETFKQVVDGLRDIDASHPYYRYQAMQLPTPRATFVTNIYLRDIATLIADSQSPGNFGLLEIGAPMSSDFARSFHVVCAKRAGQWRQFTRDTVFVAAPENMSELLSLQDMQQKGMLGVYRKPSAFAY